jgi:hypothetical protein
MCDCLVALAANTAANHTLFAKNSDRPPTESQIMRWNPSRRDSGTTRTTYIEVEASAGDTVACAISMPDWCWGAEHGVNEAGVAIGNETIYTTLDPRGAPNALIGMDVVRLGLERATSALDAVQVMSELITRYGQGGSGHDTRNGERVRPYWSSFLIADARDAWVMETSGTVIATHQVTNSWAISNRTTIPAFDARHRHPQQPVELLVDPRLNASRALLAAGPLSVQGVREHLQSQVGGRDGRTVCMHAEVNGECVEATTASMIVELSDNSTVWWAEGSPCVTPYQSARVSDLADLLPVTSGR